MMSSHKPTKALFTRAFALCLAILVPTQGILSCGPSGAQRGGSLSRVFSSKTELDFDRANNSTSTVQEGGGWNNDLSNTAEGATSIEDLPPGTPFIMDMGNGQKLVFDGHAYEVVGGDALVLQGPTTDSKMGAPVDSGSQEGSGLVAIPNGTSGAPNLVERKDGGGSPGGSYAPSFPLNPANLTKRSDVLTDIGQRLSEKEASLERRETVVEQQSGVATAKGTDGNALKGESDAARGRHSQSAVDIGGMVDALGGGADAPAGSAAGSSGQGNTFKGLPGEGLPGSLGARLKEKNSEAKSLGAAGVNSRSVDFARHAQEAYARAAQKGREGLLGDAEGDERKGDLLKRLAGTKPDVLPSLPPDGPIPADSEGNRITTTPAQTRGEALRTGLGLLDMAGVLEGSGLGAVAANARAAAHTLFEVSLGIARVSGLLDVPLSVLELTGVTPTLDENGNVALREATNLEIAFAMAALGSAGVAFVAGGWTAAVGAGVVAGLTKAASKGLGARLAVREAEAIAEEAAKNASKVVARLDHEGVEALERALRIRGRSAEFIQDRIGSFTPGTIERQVAPPGGLEVYRWHDDGVNAASRGGFVTPDLLPNQNSAREILALDKKWNNMTTLEKFRIPEGTEFFSGKVAPQGPLPGGGRQIFLPDGGATLESMGVMQ